MNWKCPFCQHKAIVRENDQKNFVQSFKPNVKSEWRIVYGQIVYCPNTECNKFTLHIYEGLGMIQEGNTAAWKAIPKRWALYPESSAKALAEYIPSVLSNDYYEACLIRDKSSKASATLSRRCLQGMIRDFWGVSRNRLVDEIDAIKDKLDFETWEAIDSVRRIGNIGAHMEKDINVIVDVDPEEAGLLIQLIETLFDEWYVTRHERQARMAGIKAVASQKDLAKKAGSAPVTPPTTP